MAITNWKTKIPSRLIDFSSRIQSDSNHCIGIKRLSTGGGSGTWCLINENGENIGVSDTYFSNHPIYKNMTEYTINNHLYISVPKFYVRSDDESVYWIKDESSITDNDGFTLHPAFKRFTREINYFYVAKYQGIDNEGTVPTTNKTFEQLKEECENKNSGGIGGYHMMSIYEYSALQLLFLIEKQTTNSQIINQGNVSSGVVLSVDRSSNSCDYHNIIDLWGNAWQYIDGIRTDKAGNVSVYSCNDYSIGEDGLYQSTNITMKRTTKNTYVTGENSGYYNNIVVDAGENYTTKYIFIPNTEKLAGNYYDGTYSDYIYCPSVSMNYCAVGGSCDSLNEAGLFAKKFFNSEEKNGYLTTRLCKF